MHTKTARAAALLVLLFCAAGLPAACDWGSEPEEQGLTGTPLERATEILGAAPTGAAARIIERGTMVVANDADYPPQSSVDESTRELVGFDVDVAKRVAEILGLEVSFKNPDWETIPAGLKQGRIDASIGSMAITPEHDKVMDFTRPYYFAPAQVVAKEGGAQITGVGDLAGKKVGVGLASTYRDYLAENSTAAIKTYPADADAFPDLLAGKLDFALTAQQTAQLAIRAGGRLEFSGEPLFHEGLGIAAAEGETDWVKLLDYVVATMHEDGSLSELSRAWFDGLDLTAGE